MMNRDVLGRQMFAKGGVARQRITDTYILETIQNLQNAMRQGNAATAAYVQENLRDLRDIAAVYPQVAPIINKGIDVLRSQTAPSLRQPMAPQMGKSLGDLMTPAPDGSMDYYAPGPFGYENGPEAPVMPEGPSEEDLRRYQENERGDQFLIPKPMPEMPSMGGGAPIEGVPMQMGGDPRAAAMAAMGAAPAAMGAAPAAMPAAPAAMPPMGAPMPTDQGPVMDEGIASQLPPEVMQILGAAARSFGDPEKAESFEEMMNMIRGVPASEEERRMELAGVVGEQDAQQTPESVLTLVQPVMLLMGAEEGGGAPVDQGIGSVAQEAMNVPVEGPMAEGIMSMAGEGASPPANFNRGGEVRRFDKGGVSSNYAFDFKPIEKPDLSEKTIPYIAVDKPVDAASNPKLDNNLEKLATTGVPVFKDANSVKVASDARSGARDAMRLAAPSVPGTTLAEELKSRTDIYNQLLGTDKSKEATQIAFLTDLAKAGAVFAQPGQSIAQGLTRALQPVAEGMGKRAAEQAATEQAVKLKALESSEKALAAEKDYGFRAALETQKGVQNLIALSEKYKYDSLSGLSAAEQKAKLEGYKARLDAAQKDIDANRAYMNETSLRTLSADIAQKQARLDAQLKEASAATANERDLQKLGVTQVFELQKETNKFAQEDKIQAARIQHDLAMQQNTLRAQEIQDQIRNANAEEKLKLDRERFALEKERVALQTSAANIERYAKVVGEPDKYLPGVFNQPVKIGDREVTKGQLWAANRLDADTSRLINQALIKAYSGKSEYDPESAVMKYKPFTRLSPENEAQILERQRTAADLPEGLVARIKLLQKADEFSRTGKRTELMASIDESAQQSQFKLLADIYGTTEQELTKNILSAQGTGGRISATGNVISGTLTGYTIGPDTAQGVSALETLGTNTLNALLGLNPNGRTNLEYQRQVKAIIPQAQRVGEGSYAFERRALALAADIMARVRQARSELSDERRFFTQSQVADMATSIAAGESLAKNWEYLAKELQNNRTSLSNTGENRALWQSP